MNGISHDVAKYKDLSNKVKAFIESCGVAADSWADWDMAPERVLRVRQQHEIPESVKQDLQQAINYRLRVSTNFKVDDGNSHPTDDDLKHQLFIRRLQRMQKLWFPRSKTNGDILDGHNDDSEREDDDVLDGEAECVTFLSKTVMGTTKSVHKVSFNQPVTLTTEVASGKIEHLLPSGSIRLTYTMPHPKSASDLTDVSSFWKPGRPLFGFSRQEKKYTIKICFWRANALIWEEGRVAPFYKTNLWPLQHTIRCLQAVKRKVDIWEVSNDQNVQRLLSDREVTELIR